MYFFQKKSNAYAQKNAAGTARRIFLCSYLHFYVDRILFKRFYSLFYCGYFG